jgi:hypothetical protein
MYFTKFPLVKYPIKDGNDFRYVFVRNLLRRVALSDELKNGTDSVFLEYDIKDGERPEHIAERVYGDPTYHWLVLLTNNVFDSFHDWYKSGSALEEYVQKKHGGTSVYFTTASDSFYYDSRIVTGVSFGQSGVTTDILDYHPTLCKLVLRGGQFVAGSAVLGFTTGATLSVKLHRSEPSYVAVHHFELDRPANDETANDKYTVDPLSQQNASFSVLGSVLGVTQDEYPSSTSQGLNYSGSGVVDFHETYIGKYMGVGTSPSIPATQINQYRVSNYTEENRVNETRRTIKILHPRFKRAAAQELESLLRV